MKQTIRCIIVDDLKDSPCPRPNCSGLLICKNSRPAGRNSVRRLYYCNKCGCAPDDNKRVSPAGVLTLEVESAEIRRASASL